MNQIQFKKIIWDYYRKHGREFSWRKNINPYRIVVSEIMLQQTQTFRVEPKFKEFIKLFPNFIALAQAPMPQILRAWQGLGYNRRALYLKRIAEAVITQYKGKLPNDPEKLIALPGIGENTVGSIIAFAFNKPLPFIETNIRRVFIHFFFKNKNNIHDKDIQELVEKTLDKEHPREWYYALMDYGAMLAKTIENPNRRSRHHLKQSKFEGSERQIRGLILKLLLNGPKKSSAFVHESGRDLSLVKKILVDLVQEGFITQKRGLWSLKS